MQSSTKIEADIKNKDYYKIKIPPEMKDTWEYLKKLPGDNHIVGGAAISLVKYSLTDEPYVPAEDIDLTCVGGQWHSLEPLGFWKSKNINHLYTLRYPHNIDLTTVYPNSHWMYLNVHTRDLASCAVYISVKDECIYDPTGRGIRDILTNTLSMINDPAQLLSQGPERVLRVFKYMIKNIDTKLEFELERALIKFSETTPLNQHVIAAMAKQMVTLKHDDEKLSRFMDLLKKFDMLRKLFKIPGPYDDMTNNQNNIVDIINRIQEFPASPYSEPLNYLPNHMIRQTPLTNADIDTIITELKTANNDRSLEQPSQEALAGIITNKEMKKKSKQEKRQAQKQPETFNDNTTIAKPSQEELETKKLKREMKKLRLKETQEEKRKENEKRAEEMAQQEALAKQQRAAEETAKKQAKELKKQVKKQQQMEAEAAQLGNNTNDKNSEADIMTTESQAVTEIQPQADANQTENLNPKKAKKKKAKKASISNAPATSSQPSSTGAVLSTTKTIAKTIPPKTDNAKSIVKQPVPPKAKISTAEKKRPIYMSRSLIGNGKTASVMIALSTLKLFQKNYDKFIDCLNFIISTNYVAEALKQLEPSLTTEVELKKLNDTLMGFFSHIRMSRTMPAKLPNLDPMFCFDKDAADDVVEYLFNSEILDLFNLDMKGKEYDHNLMHSITNSLNPGYGRYNLPPKEYKEVNDQIQTMRYKMQAHEKEALNITLKLIFKKKLSMKSNHKFVLSAEEINELKASWQAILPVQNNNSAYQANAPTLFAQQNTTQQTALANNSQLSPEL